MPEFGGYANARLRGKTVAGIAPIMQEGQPTTWNTYVKTDDARATLDAAAAAGGTIAFDAAQVADLGTMGFFIDTCRAFCGIWQPGTHIGAQLANEPGAFAWNELSTRDTESAMSFYPAVFGWSPKVHDMNLDLHRVAGGRPQHRRDDADAQRGARAGAEPLGRVFRRGGLRRRGGKGDGTGWPGLMQPMGAAVGASAQ
ncbi:MAG: hypothetical protein U0Y82_08405 [Thermoleophilia bacterium]